VQSTGTSTMCDVNDVMLTVEIPAGLHAGDEMFVTVGGQELVVVLPSGCVAGSLLQFAVPSHQLDALPATQPEQDFLDVELPPDCKPGEELQIDVEGSGPLIFIVPDGLAGSMIVRVALPRVVSEKEMARREGDGSNAEPLQCEAQCEYWVGLEVEVLRTDGRRTLGTVEGADYASGTYTVRMSDGRLKYLVDEGELGHVWAGDYRTGEVVTVRRGTQKFDARVAGHDDDEGTYSVIYSSGEMAHGIRRTSISRKEVPHDARA